MFRRMEIPADISSNEQLEAKQRIEATLHKLQVLKSRISELRAQCEELKLRAEEETSRLHCDECGRPIDAGQEIEAKNFSEKARHYHKECFRKIWLR